MRVSALAVAAGLRLLLRCRFARVATWFVRAALVPFLCATLERGQHREPRGGHGALRRRTTTVAVDGGVAHCDGAQALLTMAGSALVFI